MLTLHSSVSAPGTLSKSHVYCNSQPVPHVSPSTASRICKEVTDPAASRSKSQAKRVNCPNRTLVSTVSICRRTRPTKHSTPSFYGLSRRRSDSDRSKRVLDRVSSLQEGIFYLSFFSSSHAEGRRGIQWFCFYFKGSMVESEDAEAH
jgi:hypothetical protein